MGLLELSLTTTSQTNASNSIILFLDHRWDHYYIYNKALPFCPKCIYLMFLRSINEETMQLQCLSRPKSGAWLCTLCFSTLYRSIEARTIGISKRKRNRSRLTSIKLQIKKTNWIPPRSRMLQVLQSLHESHNGASPCRWVKPTNPHPKDVGLQQWQEEKRKGEGWVQKLFYVCLFFFERNIYLLFKFTNPLTS